MTRHSDLTPSAGTKRRAAALGVDAGVMDAIDHLGPRLTIEKWQELAEFAGRPVEDVMLDELVPEHGLGMQAWEGGSTSCSTPMLTQKTSNRGACEGRVRTPRDPERCEEERA